MGIQERIFLNIIDSTVTPGASVSLAKRRLEGKEQSEPLLSPLPDFLLISTLIASSRAKEMSICLILLASVQDGCGAHVSRFQCVLNEMTLVS